jgi:hypothetical protein
MASFTEKGWQEIDTLVAEAQKDLGMVLKKIESVLGQTAGTMFVQPPPSVNDEVRIHYDLYAAVWDANRSLWSIRSRIPHPASN